MNGYGWFFASAFGILYLTLLFTLAVLTFRRGHWILGICGIVLPFLWIIGAVIPPVRHSSSKYA
jgi:hypothetical protein